MRQDIGTMVGMLALAFLFAVPLSLVDLAVLTFIETVRAGVPADIPLEITWLLGWVQGLLLVAALARRDDAHSAGAPSGPPPPAE